MKWLVSWFVPGERRRYPAQESEKMQSDVFEEISVGDDGVGAATFALTDITHVQFRIEPGSGTFTDALILAETCASELALLNTKAKQAAAKNLLANYNDNWREFDEVQADGSLKTIKNPKLTNSEFISQLTLSDVSASADSVVRLCYTDAGMFAGHAIIVTSFSGADFANPHVDLFG